MSDKPFTFERLYGYGYGAAHDDVWRLNGEIISIEDVLSMLNSLPKTADGVPLCRLKGRTLICPRCPEGWPLMGQDRGAYICAHCNGCFLPHECITYPRKGA